MKIFAKFGEKIINCIKGAIAKSNTSKKQYADCIIRNTKGEILLLHRCYNDGFEQGKWGFPGGTIEEGENPIEAVQREVMEETGIAVAASPIDIAEKEDCIIHYFEAIVAWNEQRSPIDNTILLDIDEHRGYEWVQESKIKEYDLVCDLGNYIDSILSKCFPITQVDSVRYSNAEEAIANTGEIPDVDFYWNLLTAAFDENLISEEEFLKARSQYMELKKKEAIDTITKGFDEGIVTEEEYLEFLEKSGDPSHGGKLEKKTIIDSRGKREVKWVSKETGEAPVKEKKINQPSKEQWWSKYKQYNLNCYPIGVPQDQVKVNDSGDINGHAILTWKDPKTQAIKNAYTKEFLDRNAQQKWSRIGNISKQKIEGIKKGSLEEFLAQDNSEVNKDAAAIVYIIANTGLRRGDKLKFEKTGNRGVSTLSPENVTVENDVVYFSFQGKSYQHNTASVKNSNLAAYFRELKERKSGEKFLFSTNDATIDKTFDKVGGDGLKIKDLRTYVATDLARKILFEDKSVPPPVPKDLSVTQQKKLVQDKLKNLFEVVSQRLNNTPAMARTAYIHPQVIDAWITKLGVSFEVKKSETEEEFEVPTLDEILSNSPSQTFNAIDEECEEECDEFNLPSWWEE